MSALAFIFNLLVICGVTWYLAKSQTQNWRRLFLAMLMLRWAAGIILGCVYFFYYRNGDTISYFHDASLLSDLITRDPARYWSFLMAGENTPFEIPGLLNQVPRALYMVKLTSFFSFITANNYWVSSLYFSSLSGLCAWYFFKTQVTLFPETKLAASLAILFFPSVVFWGSGITKENAALGSLFILASVFLKLMTKTKVSWLEWIVALIAFFMAWNLKYYWLAVFIPVVLTSVFVQRVSILSVKSRSPWAVGLVWVVCFCALTGIASTLRPNFNLNRLLHVIVENHQAFISLSSAEDVIHFYQLQPHWQSMIVNAPLALVSALFRPSVLDIHTVFQGVAAMENLFIVVAIILTLAKIKLVFNSSVRVLFFSVLVYTVVLSIFLALSTPNFGTLVRYRLGYLPFFMLMVLQVFPFPDSLRKLFARLVP